MILRPYQSQLKADIYKSWADGAQNVLAVSATGSGKTVIFSDALREHDGACVAIAHRHELVSQISVALARNGVRHRIIGQPALIRTCVALHIQETKRSYYDPNARCAAAGVQTLVRMNADDAWFKSVTLWVQDETHHLLKRNQWGKAVAMFPNARGLGVTATPCRADGHGLGRHADGVFDSMVLAPGMRDLITMGYLTGYRIFAPPSDIDTSSVPLSASGDYSPEPLRKAVHASSRIVGDVVGHYLKIAPGKLGVTFAVDVESATEIAAAYRGAGIRAEVVSAKTNDAVRASILRKFASGEIKQLVNVDLFSEGFDLPALEVVSMARPTQSFALYAQQFGRSLRLMDGKDHAIIIDHVGNVHRHGLPDAHREWTLDRREKRSSASTPTTVRTCPDCTGTYDRSFGMTCPYCKYVVEPAGRSAPEQVDGHLYELDEATLARMRGERDALPTYHPDPLVCMSVAKKHREKLEAREALMEAVSLWGGRISTATDDATIAELQRRFYVTFGVDVGTAQTLNRAEAELLRKKVERCTNN